MQRRKTTIYHIIVSSAFLSLSSATIEDTTQEIIRCFSYMDSFDSNFICYTFRLKILGHEKVLGKSQIGCWDSLAPSVPYKNKNLDMALKN